MCWHKIGNEGTAIIDKRTQTTDEAPFTIGCISIEKMDFTELDFYENDDILWLCANSKR